MSQITVTHPRLSRPRIQSAPGGNGNGYAYNKAEAPFDVGPFKSDSSQGRRRTGRLLRGARRGCASRKVRTAGDVGPWRHMKSIRSLVGRLVSERPVVSSSMAAPQASARRKRVTDIVRIQGEDEIDAGAETNVPA
jgi:hypothetical protein